MLVEEFLDGQEVSLFLLCRRHERAAALPRAGLQAPARRRRRARTPAAWAPTRRCRGSTATSAASTPSSTRSSRRSRCPPCGSSPPSRPRSSGCSTAGLILTPRGIRVIEFNARFGDPETQVVLPRLVTPLSGLLFAAATGGLGELPRPEFRPDAAVTVVLASEGYPEAPDDRPPDRRARRRGIRAGRARRPRRDRDRRDRRPVGTARRHRRPRAQRRRASAPTSPRPARRAYEALGHIAPRGRAVPHRHRRARRGVTAARPDAPHSEGAERMDDAVELPAGRTSTRARCATSTCRRRARRRRLLDRRPAAPLAVVLVVASDRVSAYDHVLEPAHPRQGRACSPRSRRWWFDQLPDVPNHLAYAEDDRLELPAIPDEVADRATLCRTLDMFPIECVVRGYLTGGGWKEYQATRRDRRHPAARGALRTATACPSRSTRRRGRRRMGEHDENISYERTVELVGETVADAAARRCRSRSSRARRPIAEARGLILADTKFEFGADRDTGIVTLGRRGAHERLEPVLGCRGVRDRRDARAAHGELRQADRARLARRQLGPGRVRGAADAPARDRGADGAAATASCSSGSPPEPEPVDVRGASPPGVDLGGIRSSSL